MGEIATPKYENRTDLTAATPRSSRRCVVHCVNAGNHYRWVMCTSLDLNAAESGVQHKPAVQRNPINNDQAPNREGCSC